MQVRLQRKLKQLFVALICSSCAGVPTKPVIDLCANDLDLGQVHCVNNQTQESRSIPWYETDRFIMLSPEDWGDILIYIRALEKNKKTKIEAKKILKASTFLGYK